MPSRLDRRSLLKGLSAVAVAGAGLGLQSRTARAGGPPGAVAVLGAGAIGLMTAVRLQEQGRSVTIYADSITPGTTSDVAAGLIFPFAVPVTPQVHQAAAFSIRYYDGLAGSGMVRRQTLFDLRLDRATAEAALLPFADLVPDFTELPTGQIPGDYPFGWRFTVQFVDPVLVMPYLMKRFFSQGGAMEIRHFAPPAQLEGLPQPIVVNCTGLGSRALFGDENLLPIKGQLVDILPQQLPASYLHGSFYIFPTQTRAILGATQERMVFDPTPDEATARRIIAGNQRILPSIDRSQVIALRGGLRPFREGGPRIESERLGSKLLIHNYGHGGSGWTLAPGYAELVAQML